MLTPDQCQKLVAAAFFALPLITVKVVDITLSEGGPAPVSAAQPAAAVPAAPAALRTGHPALAPRPATANAYTDRPSRTAFGPNPFYYIPVAADSRRESPVPHPPTPPRKSAEGSSSSFAQGDFAVELIMSQPNGDLAIINGETYRVGQQIGQSPWRLISVDSNSRSVALENAQTGQTLTRTVELRRP